MNRKQGTKVTQTVSNEASTPATQGFRAPGSRKAPRNATNWTTMISGPGVDSARARPWTISPGASQPYTCTACWAT